MVDGHLDGRPQYHLRGGVLRRHAEGRQTGSGNSSRASCAVAGTGLELSLRPRFAGGERHTRSPILLRESSIRGVERPVGPRSDHSPSRKARGNPALGPEASSLVRGARQSASAGCQGGPRNLIRVGALLLCPRSVVPPGRRAQLPAGKAADEHTDGHGARRALAARGPASYTAGTGGTTTKGT